MGFLNISIRARRGSRPWQSGHPDHHSPHQMRLASRHLRWLEIFRGWNLGGNQIWGCPKRVNFPPIWDGDNNAKTLSKWNDLRGKPPIFGNTQSGRIRKNWYPADPPPPAFLRKKRRPKRVWKRRFLLHVHSLFPWDLTLLEVLLGLHILAVRTIVACCSATAFFESLICCFLFFVALLPGQLGWFFWTQKATLTKQLSGQNGAMLNLLVFLPSVPFWFATTTHSYLDSRWIQENPSLQCGQRHKTSARFWGDVNLLHQNALLLHTWYILKADVFAASPQKETFLNLEPWALLHPLVLLLLHSFFPVDGSEIREQQTPTNQPTNPTQPNPTQPLLQQDQGASTTGEHIVGQAGPCKSLGRRRRMSSGFNGWQHVPSVDMSVDGECKKTTYFVDLENL